jgi:hypothetical protein
MPGLPEMRYRAGAAKTIFWAVSEFAVGAGASRAASVWRIFSQEDHSFWQVMGRLDRVAYWMNPFLAAVVAALVILNFTYAVDLIDWRNLPETPAVSAAASSTKPITSPGSPSAQARTGSHIASPAD